MAASTYDDGHTAGCGEMEYLNKIEWLWNHLCPMQKSRIKIAMERDSLRQEHSKYCIIGQAGRLNNTAAIARDNLFQEIVFGLANTVFYDGPNYDFLLGKKVTKDEKRMLDDIYYAKIGPLEHQYKRANELVRSFMAGRMAVV